MSEHLIGLLLGTEEDWPGAFEALTHRAVGQLKVGGENHTIATERVTIEPFNLRAVPRHSLVIDRLAHWYYVPREWLKKAAVMNDVYLMNNPFTFQSMEKHTAYCAMMRLGLKVPDTWMIPHKQPPENHRFPYMAAKYNQSFRLEEVAREVGYPLFMKPFDGGAWVGVTRVKSDAELHARYDESGERLMHLQSSVENYDVFARSLSIGAETMVMKFQPDRPMHDRYEVAHGFLSPELGEEIIIISRLINAFFLWEFNSCETIVKDDQGYPIDFANACPDMSVISLHYYFPWAIKSLVKWATFCTVTGRQMKLDMQMRPYFEIGDREDLSYEQKLQEYRRLADEHFDIERYNEFCSEHLAHVDEAAIQYFSSDDFDRLLVDTVRSTFPAHEHDKFVPHYRGLIDAWVTDQHATI